MPESSGALGIFGGTFDPPHIAHLRLAIEAREALHLTGVVFVPAGSPPLRGSPQASPTQRLAMVERAIADMPDCSVDASEVMASGPSYTVATLERLRAQHGAARPLILLIGHRRIFPTARLAALARLVRAGAHRRGDAAGARALAAKNRRWRYGGNTPGSRTCRRVFPPPGRCNRHCARACRPHRAVRHHAAGNFRHADPPAPGAGTERAPSGERPRSRLY